MPVLLRTEIPASFVPYIRDEAIPYNPWTKYLLNVHTPRSYVRMNTEFDYDTGVYFAQNNEEQRYGTIVFKQSTWEWSHCIHWNIEYQDDYHILMRGEACIKIRYEIVDQIQDEWVIDYSQPELWVRSDELAEFLGGVGPKVGMPPEILADWLEDRAETPREKVIVRRIRALIESKVAKYPEEG